MGMISSVALRTPVALFGKRSAKGFGWSCDAQTSGCEFTLPWLRMADERMRRATAERWNTDSWKGILGSSRFWLVADATAWLPSSDAVSGGKRGIPRGMLCNGGTVVGEKERGKEGELWENPPTFTPGSKEAERGVKRNGRET